MGEKKDIQPCAVCGTKYVNSPPLDAAAGPKYYNCPTCGYSAGIPVEIKSTIANMSENITKKKADELSDLLVKDLVKNWPNPNK